MHKYCFKIDIDDENQRLDSFLSSMIPSHSRTELQSLIKSQKVFVNSTCQKPSYLLKQNDEIILEIRDEKTVEIPAWEVELDIRYEDEHMLVVNKPWDMLTHPTSKEREKTLVNALLSYTKGQLSDINGVMRPGIVHRLDRNTSGLLMVAKTNEAHGILVGQIKNRFAKRKYLAVVTGNFQEPRGTIEFDIGRSKLRPEKMAVVEGGKPSRTHYKVLESFNGFSYLELELDTGRTHQIRVHLSHIGHPIVNDSLYGGRIIKVKTHEQVLQAYSLSFLQIGSNSDIMVTIDENSELKKVLSYLRSSE